MEMDWKEQALKLAEIGDRMADELSILRHSKGISSDAQKAIDDWDPVSMELRIALRAR